ncbi:uncharacterized protein V1516DRAFT_677941 [Lipomyces oligophaga]|uniref:uncharacterized protein n=1 Tax=Lipomyces oligophaga TaxID=45792 RepID=UPI0034CDC7F3
MVDPLEYLPSELFADILFYGEITYFERQKLRAVSRAWKEYIDNDPHSFDLFEYTCGIDHSKFPQIGLAEGRKILAHSLGALCVVSPSERANTDSIWPNFRDRPVGHKYISLERIFSLYLYTRFLYDCNPDEDISANLIPKVSWYFLYRVPPRAKLSNDLRVLYHAGIDEGFFKTFLQFVTDKTVWYQESDLNLLVNNWIWNGWKEMLLSEVLQWVSSIELKITCMHPFVASLANSDKMLKRLTFLKFFDNPYSQQISELPSVASMLTRVEVPIFPNLLELRINEWGNIYSQLQDSHSYFKEYFSKSKKRLDFESLTGFLSNSPELKTLALRSLALKWTTTESRDDYDLSIYKQLEKFEFVSVNTDGAIIFPKDSVAISLENSNFLPLFTSGSDMPERPILCEKLVELNLRANSSVNFHSLQALISSTSCPRLKALLIGSNQFLTSSSELSLFIEQFLKTNRAITDLDLSSLTATDDDVLQTILSHLLAAPRLSRLVLDLSGTSVTDEKFLSAEREFKDCGVTAYTQLLIDASNCYKAPNAEMGLYESFEFIDFQIHSSPETHNWHSHRVYNFERKYISSSERGSCLCCPCCSTIW